MKVKTISNSNLVYSIKAFGKVDVRRSKTSLLKLIRDCCSLVALPMHNLQEQCQNLFHVTVSLSLTSASKLDLTDILQICGMRGIKSERKNILNE